jgi:hypothetical protein
MKQVNVKPDQKGIIPIPKKPFRFVMYNSLKYTTKETAISWYNNF